MLERFVTSLTKPKEIFKYKEDSGMKAFSFYCFISTLYAVLLTASYKIHLVNSTSDSDNILKGLFPDNLIAAFFFSFFYIFIGMFFGALFLTIITFLFSANRDKTFGLFFKINFYISGPLMILNGVVAVINPILAIFFGGTVLFVLTIIYLFKAYGGAKNY